MTLKDFAHLILCAGLIYMGFWMGRTTLPEGATVAFNLPDKMENDNVADN